jgi:hypothetical protein
MDYKIASKLLQEFGLASQTAHQGFGYQSGYYTSLILDLLAQVPSDVCFQYLQRIESETRRLKRSVQVDQ